MFCQFQKVYKLLFFWDYTRNIRPESSKAKAGRDKVISCSCLEQTGKTRKTRTSGSIEDQVLQLSVRYRIDPSPRIIFFPFICEVISIYDIFPKLESWRILFHYTEIRGLFLLPDKTCKDITCNPPTPVFGNDIKVFNITTATISIYFLVWSRGN